MLNNIAEEATGIKQNGKLGKFFDKRGIDMPIEEARAVLLMGEPVEVPNAGAGSYQEFFKAMGFDDVKVVDWTSSAGDWCFGVKHGKRWYFSGQENRWPYHGFKYSVDIDGKSYPSFGSLINEVKYS